ncbi:hypothetical protein P9112_005140 [Eukaryota sp. TZLM1-RC]
MDYIPPSTLPTEREGSSADIRTPLCHFSVVSKATGSVYIESGNSKLICSVYGPHQSKSSEFHNKANLFLNIGYSDAAHPSLCDPSFSYTPKLRLARSAVLSSLNSSLSLHKYPKSAIDIAIYIIEDDGSIPSLCVLAASLACKDAGIEAKHIVVSSTLALSTSPSDTSAILDPWLGEEMTADSLFVLSSVFGTEEIVSVDFIGKLELVDLKDLVNNLVSVNDSLSNKLIDLL